MGNTFYFGWEVRLMEWLQTNLPGWLVQGITKLSFLGEQIPLLVILVLLLWGIDKKRAKTLGLIVAANCLCVPFIKNMVLRRRPYMDNEGIQLLRKIDADADIYDISAQGYSFPSGHSSNSVSIYGGLARLYRKKWMIILAPVLCLLVGFSRVVAGAHYPTDVLCGWAAGTVLVFVIPWLVKKLKKEWIVGALLLVLTFPGFFFCKSTDFYTGYGMMLGLVIVFPFEEKFVRFTNTTNWGIRILRVAVGGGLYFALNALCKLPFPADFLESATTGAYLVRTGRYALVLFLLVGIYPLTFRLEERLFSKKERLNG